MKEETAKRRKTERSFSRLMQCSTEAERERARWEEGGEGAEEWRQRSEVGDGSSGGLSPFSFQFAPRRRL